MAPLDEALTRAVVDLSGRGWAESTSRSPRETLGDVSTENLIHFMTSLAIEAQMSLHVDTLRGVNNHHIAESAFKALAIALAQAITPRGDGVLSTKGTLDMSVAIVPTGTANIASVVGRIRPRRRGRRRR